MQAVQLLLEQGRLVQARAQCLLVTQARSGAREARGRGGMAALASESVAMRAGQQSQTHLNMAFPVGLQYLRVIHDDVLNYA